MAPIASREDDSRSYDQVA